MQTPTSPPALTSLEKIQAELVEIDRAAAAKKAALQPKLDAVQMQAAELDRLRREHLDARQRVANAESQLEIVRARSELALSKAVEFIGSPQFTHASFKVMSVSPIADNPGLFPLTNGQPPYVFHSGELAGLAAAASLIESRLRELQLAAETAQAAMVGFANQNGIAFEQ